MAKLGGSGYVKSLSENQKAAAGFIKFGVILVVLFVIVYSEIMFLSIVSVLFPPGIGYIGATIGAVATGASIALLYAGKSHWFTPGPQLIFAWIFTGVEVVVMVMNDILAYSMHNGHLDANFALWKLVTPATPVVALVGWIVITFLDRAQRERHANMELEARKADSERAYIEAAHRAEMELRHQHLEQVTGQLQDVMNSAAIQQRIADHAARLVDRVLTDVTGISASTTISSVPNRQPQQIKQPVSLAQTDELPVTEPQGMFNMWLNGDTPKK